MCPVGMVLVKTFLVWNMTKGQWTNVIACEEKNESRIHTIDLQTKQEVQLRVAIVKDKKVFYIYEE